MHCPDLAKRYLPDRMQTPEFWDSITDERLRMFQSLLKSQGTRIATNYLKVVYNEKPEVERFVPRKCLASGKKVLLKEDPLIGIITRKNIHVQTEWGLLKVEYTSFRSNQRIIAIALNDGKAIGYSLSKSPRLASQAIRKRSPLATSYLLFPINFQYSRELDK
jgi:hypothetical protein